MSEGKRRRRSPWKVVADWCVPEWALRMRPEPTYMSRSVENLAALHGVKLVRSEFVPPNTAYLINPAYVWRPSDGDFHDRGMACDNDECETCASFYAFDEVFGR